MTIPNLITIFRIILTPIFIINLIDDNFLPALFIFIIAGVSDAADGFIARMFNQKSKLGSFMDPLADKILLVSAFVMLSAKGLIQPWLAVIVISRDLLIMLGVLILFLNNQNFAARPSVWSKMTTCLQLMTVFVVLTKDYFSTIYSYSPWLLWATGAMTILSGLHYTRHWLKILGEGPIKD
ncbi:putative CDP-diacylglycerol--glycerol-3-phosphate 3-phosphatidyltransferase [uncultured Desulfobacterium sp.]|uniref:CDP-diacylglycerol--glycerol-3-phosphate 3-phosphatidyltransferase n=1 Tax=uncultured Desulfobacterium sp. TaxID=201089 RepID=A0A445N3C3_9BACT|nr:putative CDP-diacylglycerol--glycerol-3-phosphate 3-phosphatidyltransferase [uncultured Desulfobacterium sp.]